MRSNNLLFAEAGTQPLGRSDVAHESDLKGMPGTRIATGDLRFTRARHHPTRDVCSRLPRIFSSGKACAAFGRVAQIELALAIAPTGSRRNPLSGHSPHGPRPKRWTPGPARLSRFFQQETRQQGSGGFVGQLINQTKKLLTDVGGLVQPRQFVRLQRCS
jgi:hypothetical protein